MTLWNKLKDELDRAGKVAQGAIDEGKLRLEAFRVGGSVRNVLLVLGCNAVAAVVPFTPGGAGVQQALLVKVFAGTASGATVAAYSVGQQIAIAVFSLGVGFFALVLGAVAAWFGGRSGTVMTTETDLQLVAPTQRRP